MSAKPVQQEGLVGSIQSEVAAEASPLLQFLVAHAMKIVAAIVLFIAAIGAYWFYTSHSESRRLTEARELGQYLIISDPAMRLEKLEAYAPSAPDSVRPALYFAIMEAATQLDDQDKIYAAWKAVSELDAAIRPTAYLGMAGALSNQGKYREALDLLSGIAPGLTGGDSANVNTRVIFLAEVVKDYNRALAACDVLIGQAPSVDDALLWTQKKDDIQRKIKESAAQGQSGATAPAAAPDAGQAADAAAPSAPADAASGNGAPADAAPADAASGGAAEASGNSAKERP